MTLLRLEPAALQSGVKHSTTEPLCSHLLVVFHISSGGRLALDLINNDPHILPEHSLELVVSNSECLPDVAMKAFIKYITNNTIPITAVLGTVKKNLLTLRFTRFTLDVLKF